MDFEKMKLSVAPTVDRLLDPNVESERLTQRHQESEALCPRSGPEFRQYAIEKIDLVFWENDVNSGPPANTRSFATTLKGTISIPRSEPH
jgi:hypothetical protein